MRQRMRCSIARQTGRPVRTYVYVRQVNGVFGDRRPFLSVPQVQQRSGRPSRKPVSGSCLGAMQCGTCTTYKGVAPNSKVFKYTSTVLTIYFTSFIATIIFYPQRNSINLGLFFFYVAPSFSFSGLVRCAFVLYSARRQRIEQPCGRLRAGAGSRRFRRRRDVDAFRGPRGPQTAIAGRRLLPSSEPEASTTTRRTSLNTQRSQTRKNGGVRAVLKYHPGGEWDGDGGERHG